MIRLVALRTSMGWLRRALTRYEKDEVNAALEAAHLPRDTMTLVFNPIVVNTGSKLVAIDTGYGAAEAKPNTTHGQYQQNLAAAGIDAKAIGTVIISHYHQSKPK